MATTTYTKTGNKSSKAATLPKEIFAAKKVNQQLIAEVYEAYLANKRSAGARTKTRTQVRGGGRKPWMQKGLGRARVGSIRSPIWRGGGITFGPTGNENHERKYNKSTLRSALVQALTMKAKDGEVAVIEDVEVKDGKTKTLRQLLDKLQLGRDIVIVTAERNESLTRASSNLPGVKLTSADSLNVKSVVDADSLLLTKPAVDKLKQRLGGVK